VAVTSGLGALPSRFRRERLLIVGYGDVGQRMARNLLTGPGAASRLRVLALTSQAETRGCSLRAQGHSRRWCGNLDQRCQRCAVFRAWPPAWCTWHHRRVEGGGGAAWWRDPRTVALARSLAAAQPAGCRWCMPRPAGCMATAQGALGG
jgi:hypothetical protein